MAYLQNLQCKDFKNNGEMYKCISAMLAQNMPVLLWEGSNCMLITNADTRENNDGHLYQARVGNEVRTANRLQNLILDCMEWFWFGLDENWDENIDIEKIAAIQEKGVGWGDKVWGKDELVNKTKTKWHQLAKYIGLE